MIHKLLIVFMLVLASCSEKQQQSDSETELSVSSVSQSKTQSEIAWHSGDLESAFREAQASDRPVFLYWGAEWCPPCNQLKATLFKEPDFIALTQFFVPVYLDGDTERAQIHGETYGVSGYPTLVVLTPDQQELTRIPGGMDLQRYPEVLQLVLQEQKPVSQIVENFQNGNSLSEKDFSVLALYSWWQDRGQVLVEGEEESLLYALYQACPPSQSIAKSRLFSVWWYFLKNTHLQQEGYVLSDEKKQVLLQESETILLNEELIYNNLEFVLYDRGALLTLLDEQQERFIAMWYKALEKTQGNKSLPLLAQLTPIRTKIYLENPGKEPEAFTVSPTLKQEIIDTVETTRKSKLKSYEHSVVMNLFWYMLTTAGLYEEADRIFKEELANSDAPYYFMVDVAQSAQELGRHEEALEWLQRAYEEAKDGATKFQWGVMYLEGAVEMFPEKKELIVTIAQDVLGQLHNREDAFFNRNQLRAKRIEKALLTWNEQGIYDAELRTVATSLKGLCGNWQQQPEGENYQRCSALLASLEKSST